MTSQPEESDDDTINFVSENEFIKFYLSAFPLEEGYIKIDETHRYRLGWSKYDKCWEIEYICGETSSHNIIGFWTLVAAKKAIFEWKCPEWECSLCPYSLD